MAKRSSACSEFSFVHAEREPFRHGAYPPVAAPASFLLRSSQMDGERAVLVEIRSSFPFPESSGKQPSFEPEPCSLWVRFGYETEDLFSLSMYAAPKEKEESTYRVPEVKRILVQQAGEKSKLKDVVND